MVASDYEMSPVVARGVKRDVERLGFDIDLRLVPTDEMYVKWCGVPKARVAICPNVGWFADFLDPQSMLEPTFNGDAIRRQWEVNWSLLDDAEINDAMAEASLILAGPKRSAAWGHINRMIVEKAPGIPYLWDTNYQLESSDVGGVVNPYYQLWDLSFTAVKP
jgi:peptide/nickel transport system substrate-binding protein